MPESYSRFTSAWKLVCVAEGWGHERTVAQVLGRFGVNASADHPLFLGVPLREVRRQQIEQLRGTNAGRELHEVGHRIDGGMQLLVQRVADERLAY